MNKFFYYLTYLIVLGYSIAWIRITGVLFHEQIQGGNGRDSVENFAMIISFGVIYLALLLAIMFFRKKYSKLFGNTAILCLIACLITCGYFYFYQNNLIKEAQNSQISFDRIKELSSKKYATQYISDLHKAILSNPSTPFPVVKEIVNRHTQGKSYSYYSYKSKDLYKCIENNKNPQAISYIISKIGNEGDIYAAKNPNTPPEILERIQKNSKDDVAREWAKNTLKLVQSNTVSKTDTANLSSIDEPKQNTLQDTKLEQGTYRALLVANKNYSDPQGKWDSLRTPANDARRLKEVLEENYRFEDIQYLQDAKRTDIYKALRNLIIQSQPNDNVLIFFAGHGHFDEITELGYWIPTDARGTDDAYFVSNEDIRIRVAKLAKKCQHVLLISDSCFSGTLIAKSRGIKVKSKTNNYFNKMQRQKSCQIISSGGREYVDDNYRGTGHSPFAHFLINKLESNTDKFLSASELGLHMSKTVTNASGQTPRSGRLRGSFDELGEFFFIRK